MEKILITDYGFKDIEQEKRIITQAGFTLSAQQCKTAEDVLFHGADAVGLLVQWAPVTASVIAGLKKCKIIVRYGIGVDNVDLEAAKNKGIVVCNVPDYCIAEVADHTVALALSLARQLTETHNRTVAGEWKITPPSPALPFYEMKFATIGFGRIAKEVHKRVSAFGFSKIAYDPHISNEALLQEEVIAVSFDEAVETADIISLHLPLSAQTHHIMDRKTLLRLKKGAIIVNTSRGGLIDTHALASIVETGHIAAGLDVFEEEPLSQSHPLRQCKNVVLTSHTAWYSEKSVPTLQRMAAEVLVAGILDGIFNNRIV